MENAIDFYKAYSTQPRKFREKEAARTSLYRNMIILYIKFVVFMNYIMEKNYQLLG